jgi:LysR family transcriptional regulator of gallate degradation
VKEENVASLQHARGSRATAADLSANALSLRHLTRVVALADLGNSARVADLLNCSPAAVTKSVNEIERLLHCRLFDRVGAGYRVTRAGEILARRSRIAAEIYNRVVSSSAGSRPVPISNKRVDAVLAVFERGNLRQAAADLGITTSAVYGALAALEKTWSRELFHRSEHGELIPTQFGHELVRALKRMRAEIRFALEEIANVSRGVRGRVNVGVLPRAREYLLPRAINRLLEDHPEIVVSGFDATSPTVLSGVRTGDLDFVVGPLWDRSEEPGLHQEPLLSDHLIAITRKDHPLAGIEDLSLAHAIRDYGWIVGLREGMVWSIFRRVLESNGLADPERMIETNSFSLMRGLLLEGDWIGVSSMAEIHNFPGAGQLATLDLHLTIGDDTDATLPISVIRRSDTTLPPAAALALEYLYASAAEFEAELQRSRFELFRRLRSVPQGAMQ